MKQGVNLIIILGRDLMACRRCCTKITNLLTIYNYQTTKEDYKAELEKLMFSSIGFSRKK